MKENKLPKLYIEEGLESANEKTIFGYKITELNREELLAILGNFEDKRKINFKESLDIEKYELKAALGVMLTTWDLASEKLAAFLKDKNANTANEYGDTIPKLYEASTLARIVHKKWAK